ncbi:hypothetical protein [Streptomyces alkaliphilus]|uniref:hypothetical protein n=1 Tax=Streptomyces alkaliphilus TaxID=1472722 RepID=UPI00118048BD|nr:hypothetical protein [Streptomyces alkaliphilus]MQS06774.1 hypothetical protein [Streptomyces alkaliphilus]
MKLMSRAKGARFQTDFDSSANTVRALGSFLHGESHRGMSMGPGSPRLANGLARLPRPVRRRIFAGMGYQQAIPLDRVRDVRIEDLDEWVVQQYGPGPYPAVVIGSTSGAVVHLAAALGAPFLPQTQLVSVRDTATHPDDPRAALDAIAPLARRVAANNPGIAVYHMHDPGQDRAMLEKMAYLRLKRLELGETYERFIEERLAPGAPVIQVECTRDWRTREVGDRTYFQFGCLGGIPEEEYHDTGERITDFLHTAKSDRDGWEPPEPDARRPEAEWGFHPSMAEDIRRVAERSDHPVRRLVFEDPQVPSAFVADFYRSWYRERGLAGNRLLVESYVQWDPLWALKVGAVPFWLRFNMRPSLDALTDYLEESESAGDPWDEIHLNVFSQGLKSPGVVPPKEWRRTIERYARRKAEIIGVDEEVYPVDPGSTMRFQPAFEGIEERQPLPPPLPPEAIDTFLAEHGGGRYGIGWS